MILNRKVIFPFVILMGSTVYLFEAIRLGQPITAEGIRPSFVPIVLGILSSIFSLVLTIQALSDARKEAGTARRERASEADESSVAPAIQTIVAISIYIALFPMIGYFLSSALFVFAITTIFSERNRWLSKLATTAAIVAFGYIVFEQLFGVRLPALWG